MISQALQLLTRQLNEYFDSVEDPVVVRENIAMMESAAGNGSLPRKVILTLVNV